MQLITVKKKKKKKKRKVNNQKLIQVQAVRLNTTNKLQRQPFPAADVLKRLLSAAEPPAPTHMWRPPVPDIPRGDHRSEIFSTTPQVTCPLLGAAL